MTGRGIDQILLHPSSPKLYEPYVKSALGYVDLAETANGPIPRRVEPSYIWGDALAALTQAPADLRIINLESSVTRSDAAENKGINYRMNPANLDCLSAAGIDCCVLANNHVRDWGNAGLLETLQTLDAAGIGHAGAGTNLQTAEAPCVMEVPGKTRVLVFGFGLATSGIPDSWRAGNADPGISLLHDLSRKTIDGLTRRIAQISKPEDFVIASIHWSANWGYDVTGEETAFAHALIDHTGVDLVHGHSSHHPKGGEVYNDKLILYGCGDFINDYEGIGGRENYRPELVCLYRVKISLPEKQLASLEIVPFKTKNFQLRHVNHRDSMWLADVLDREYRRFGAGIRLSADDVLRLEMPG